MYFFLLSELLSRKEKGGPRKGAGKACRGENLPTSVGTQQQLQKDVAETFWAINAVEGPGIFMTEKPSEREKRQVGRNSAVGQVQRKTNT